MAFDTDSFRVTKNQQQPILVAMGGATRLILTFENKGDEPVNDPGNHFYQDTYMADNGTTKRFIVENIRISDLPTAWQDDFVTATLSIKKNGTTIFASATIDRNTIDAYSSSILTNNSYTFPPLIADAESFVATDIYTVEMTFVSTNFNATMVVAEGKFSST